MADSVSINVLNAQEIASAFAAVAASLTASETRKVFLGGARLLVPAIRERAPRRTGMLRRSVAAFASKTNRKERAAATTWVRMFRGAVRAPHAHLVEFGTPGARSSGGKLMRFKADNGKWVAKRIVGRMPGSFFFRRAVEAEQGRVFTFLARETELIIQNRWVDTRNFFTANR